MNPKPLHSMTGDSDARASTCDVIVVGAGPAGSALAIPLARAGWRILLIDASRFPRHKVCGECLSGSALPLLESLQVGPEIRRHAVLLNAMQIVLPGDLRLALNLPNDAAGMVSISRYVLDQVLLEQAQRAGAEVLLGWRVRELLAHQGRAQGVVAAPADQHAAAREFRAPLLVAADGRGSLIVQRTGRVVAVGPHLVGFKRHWRFPDKRVAEPPRSVEMLSLPGGYLGICPVGDHAVNTCGVMPRGLLREHRGSVDAALAQLLEKHLSAAAQLRGLIAEGDWLSVSDVRRQQAWPVMGGVLYVGDACGTIEPLAGQGMCMALAGAQIAARSLLAASPDAVDAAWQDRYWAEWHAAFMHAIDWAARFGWLLRHPTALGALANLMQVPARWRSALVGRAYASTRLR